MIEIRIDKGQMSLKVHEETMEDVFSETLAIIKAIYDDIKDQTCPEYADTFLTLLEQFITGNHDFFQKVLLEEVEEDETK